MGPARAKNAGEGWEFKILRTAAGRFGDPARLRAVLVEEARAGWTLLEKFDDNRLRLKRPASTRSRDASLGFDPYRSFVGPNQAMAVALATGAVLLAAGAFVALTLAMVWLSAGR